MRPEIHAWLVVVHLFGLVLWTGAMLAGLQMLRAHSALPEAAREPLSGAERKTAIIMDIGATIAILSGLYLAIALIPSPFKSGWFHAKLTLVVIGLLGMHGFLRVKVRKFRQGQVAPLPGFLLPVLFLLIFGVLVLVRVKPF